MKYSSNPVFTSGWEASRALAGLMGLAAQFLCGRDALDGSNKRKDALVSFALGCLKGEQLNRVTNLDGKNLPLTYVVPTILTSVVCLSTILEPSQTEMIMCCLRQFLYSVLSYEW